MRTSSFHILRVGLAITYLWVGVLIFRDPAAWGGLIASWATDLLPLEPARMMIGTAVFDTLVGALLLVDVWTWWASLFASFHFAVIVGVVGINAVTVRDLGLLAASLALLNSVPAPRFLKRD